MHLLVEEEFYVTKMHGTAIKKMSTVITLEDSGVSEAKKGTPSPE